MEVLIATPEGLVYKGSARKVVVPAHDGELGVLSRHAPLVAELGVGELRLHSAGAPEELSFFIEGGFVEVFRNRLTVLATKAEPVSAIDPARAEGDVRALIAEAQPPGMGIEARTQRTERIRVAKKRAELAARRRIPRAER